MPKADIRRRRTGATRDEFVVERWIAATTVVLTLLVFVPAMHETYVLPKFVALVLGAVALVAVTGWRAADRAALEIPTSTGAILLGVVAVAMIVSTLAGSHRAQSLAGAYGRSDGLVTYLAAAVIFAGVLCAFDRESLRFLARAACIAGGVIVAYGFLQALGIHLVEKNPTTTATLISTLGQANLVAGALAVVAPLLVWVVTDRSVSLRWRRAAGAMLVAVPIVAVRVQSFQVLPAIVLSLGVTGAVMASDRWGGRRVARAVGGLTVLSLVVAAVFAAQLEREIRSGLDERVLFWQAALDMIRDAPVLGRGLSGFATSFATFRPESHALRFGSFQIADAPHNVPLGMFVSGGVLLGLAYLAFVVFIAVRLVQGVRRLEGPSRALLAAVGGSWVGYQAQSLISIDVPPLILMHFVLAAMILVLVEDRRTRRIDLPWTPRARGRSAQTSGPQLAIRGAVVLAVLVACLLVLRPAQADLAFARGLDLRPPPDAPPQVSDQSNKAALIQFRRSTELAPWVGRYWADLAATHVALGDQESAIDAGRKAADLSPSVVSYALAVAQLAERVGEQRLADSYYSLAVENGPNDPAALNARAEYLLRAERFEDASALLERALALGRENIDYLLHLAAAYRGMGLDDKADEVYEEVLSLAPSNPEALENLGRTPQP